MRAWLNKAITHSSSHIVDLLLIVKLSDGYELFRCGGRWDRDRRAYIGPANESAAVVFECNPDGQEKAARCFLTWLAAHGGCKDWYANDRTASGVQVFSIGLLGERGGGKTRQALAFTAALLLAFPGSILQCVSPQASNREEIVPPLRTMFSTWGERTVLSGAEPRTTICNGSSVRYLTGENSLGARVAGLPIVGVLVNEAQEHGKDVVGVAAPGVRNLGGLVLWTANPGGQRASGRDAPGIAWVTKLRGALIADELASGDLGRVFSLSPKQNQHISQGAQAQATRLLEIVDPQRARSDMQGDWRPSDRYAVWSFDSRPRELGGCVGRPPDIGWISWRDGRSLTEAVTAERYANHVNKPEGQGWPLIIAVDFDQAVMPALVGELWERHDGALVAWIKHEIVGEHSVQDLVAKLDRAGIKPEHAIVIGDSTSDHQGTGTTWIEVENGTLRQVSRQRSRAWEALEERGYTVVSPNPPSNPRHRVGQNPPVSYSLRELNELIVNRRVLIDPSCKDVIVSVENARLKPNTDGKKLDKSADYNEYTHRLDSLRYWTWWAMPAVRYRRQARAGVASSKGELR